MEIFEIFECLPNQIQLINILNFLDSSKLYRRLLVSQVWHMIQIKSHRIQFQFKKLLKWKNFMLKNHYTYFSTTWRKCLNSVNLWNYEGLWTKSFVRLYAKFTLFNHCWFIRILVIVAGCSKKWSEDFITSSNYFHAFQNTPQNTHSCIFFFNITMKMWEFWKT